MISDEDVDLLRMAVVKQAVHEYRCALRWNCKREIISLERFFLHDLEIWCDLDGRHIIDEIRKQVNNHSGGKTL